MASEPVRSTAVVAAPKDYSIPGAQVIRLLSARAAFTDNGAGGDWLPALQVLDNNGNVLVTAADQGVKVTAGSDADVSWFPGVKVAAATTPTTSSGQFAHSFRDNILGTDGAQLIPATSTRNVNNPHAATTDNTVMFWQTLVNANDTLSLAAVGTYLVYATTHWDIADPGLTTTITSFSETDFPHTPFLPSGNPSVGDSIGSAQSMDFTVFHVTIPTVNVVFRHGNTTAIDENVQQSYCTAVYLATT